MQKYYDPIILSVKGHEILSEISSIINKTNESPIKPSISPGFFLSITSEDPLRMEFPLIPF